MSSVSWEIFRCPLCCPITPNLLKIIISMFFFKKKERKKNWTLFSIVVVVCIHHGSHSCVVFCTCSSPRANSLELSQIATGLLQILLAWWADGHWHVLTDYGDYWERNEKKKAAPSQRRSVEESSESHSIVMARSWTLCPGNITWLLGSRKMLAKESYFQKQELTHKERFPKGTRNQ